MVKEMLIVMVIVKISWTLVEERERLIHERRISIVVKEIMDQE